MLSAGLNTEYVQVLCRECLRTGMSEPGGQNDQVSPTFWYPTIPNIHAFIIILTSQFDVILQKSPFHSVTLSVCGHTLIITGVNDQMSP